MRTLKIQIQIIFIFFLVSILFFGCKSSEDSSSATTDADSSTTETDTTSSSLASSIISELESNLSSSSSSRTGRVSTRPNSKTLSNNLNASQISQIKEAALQAVSSGNLGESEDLIQLMPKIIEGAQGKLSDLGLSDSTEAINVINVINVVNVINVIMSSCHHHVTITVHHHQMCLTEKNQV